MRSISLSIPTFLLAGLFSCSQPITPDYTTLIFVGTYTKKLGHVDGQATGIYTCAFNIMTGVLTVIDSVTDIENPSFLTISPDKKYLYAVAENGGSAAQPFGSVAAYRVGEKGKLTKINAVSSYGVAPCHVSTDRSGKWVFVANYGTGNVLSYRIQPDGGLSDSLCMHRHPGTHPWAHQVVASPDNTLLYAMDKGSDHIFLYDIQQNGTLKPKQSVATAPGAGPRHLDFCPTDPTHFATINELNNSVTTYRYSSATGDVTRLDSLTTLPPGFTGTNTGADIHYHPNGRFLYGSNRGHHSIAMFQVTSYGKLSALGQVSSSGQTPRNFMITADGKWMLAANQNSSNVQVYRIDAATGMLSTAGKPYRVPTPVCLKQW